MRAMSLIGGCSCQPERVTTAVTSTGAPHLGQEEPDASLGMRQYRQV